MESYDVYKDIAERTDGDIFVGVVGPVRTGKSTFIKRFTEKMVIPNISGKSKKQVAIDEMPQSSGGKTVMTTEPKFIPSEAVGVNVGSGSAKIRLIDCVGYMVDGALGGDENGSPRLVKTPWQDEEMPFEKAAEYGTHKVICEHSTIGVVITTDGSFTEISRSSYERAEERVVKELKEINKPFIVVLNCQNPMDEKSQHLRKKLEDKYGVTTLCLNVLEADERELTQVIEKVLFEFPMKRIDVMLPEWIRALPYDNEVVQKIIQTVKESSKQVVKMRDYEVVEKAFSSIEKVHIPESTSLELGQGNAVFSVGVDNGLFYDVLSKESGESIDGEYALMKYVKELSVARKEYDKIKGALKDAEENGYGIVSPNLDEITLTSPEIVKDGNRHSVSIGAEATSLHIIKVDVKANVNPIVGSEKQCDDFIQFVSNQDGENQEILNTNVYGRSLGSMVEAEVTGKALGIKKPLQDKIRKVAQKSVNDGKNNLIYVLL